MCICVNMCVHHMWLCTHVCAGVYMLVCTPMWRPEIDIG